MNRDKEERMNTKEGKEPKNRRRTTGRGMAAILLLAVLLLAGCGKSGAGKAAEEKTSEGHSLQISTQSRSDSSMQAKHEEKEGTTPRVSSGSENQRQTGKSSSLKALEAVPADAESSSESQKPEKNLCICLDPGHSSVMPQNSKVKLGPGSSETKMSDTGGTRGVSTGQPEYELVFTVAEQLREELDKRGYEVVMTREDNHTPVDLEERAEIANAAEADAMVRLHANGSDDSSAKGALGICITRNNPFISQMYEPSRALTDRVLEAYCQETGFASKGVWETDTMATSNWTKMPTTLIELGFMTNPEEDRQMADPEVQKKMVQGIADGIDNYFEVK